MTYKEIKKILIDQDKTLTGLARKFKVSHTAIWRLFQGDMQSARLKRLIAKELNVDYKELWQEKEAA
jgi:DNA-binding Xre family transcriptional regulator